MGNSIKLFISYSWTNQDHETWVLNLAKELVENGVHVVIDKWDLKEGQDSYSFMEKMVSDTEIQKVKIWNIWDEINNMDEEDFEERQNLKELRENWRVSRKRKDNDE